MICSNLRKRWVLSAIFITSVIYFLYNTAQLPGGRIGHRIDFLRVSLAVIRHGHCWHAVSTTVPCSYLLCLFITIHAVVPF